jgi:hypothetical protein
MSRPFEITVPLELAYRRRGLFALELLDPITLDRVNTGVLVEADGLRGTPSVNSSGLFFWLDEDITRLKTISVNPQRLPYDSLVLTPAQLNLSPTSTRVTTIELPPRVDYPLSAGITAGRGTLIETRVTAPQVPTPVPDADVHLRWLDEDGVTWRDAPTLSRTNTRGDFVAVLRLSSTDAPHLDANTALTVRLGARREGVAERESADFKLPQGRVADASTLSALIFAWDELQP